MSHYKIKYGQSREKKARPTRTRIYRCAFKSGRKLGYDQGYTEGLDAGYEKGYAEGSSLGYNNGFFTAIDLKYIDDEEEKIVSILKSLIASEDISIHIRGERVQEIGLLFRQLGIQTEKGLG